MGQIWDFLRSLSAHFGSAWPNSCQTPAPNLLMLPSSGTNLGQYILASFANLVIISICRDFENNSLSILTILCYSLEKIHTYTGVVVSCVNSVLWIVNGRVLFTQCLSSLYTSRQFTEFTMTSMSLCMFHSDSIMFVTLGQPTMVKWLIDAFFFSFLSLNQLRLIN